MNISPLCLRLCLLAACVFSSHAHAQNVLYRQVFGNVAATNNVTASSVKWGVFDAATGAVNISSSKGTAYDISKDPGKTTDLPNVNSATSVTNMTNGYFFTQGQVTTTTSLPGGALAPGDIQLVIPDAMESAYIAAHADLDPAHYSSLTFSWEALNLTVFNGGVNGNVLRVAVQIGGKWYATATPFVPRLNSAAFASAAVEQSFTFTAEASAWNTLTFKGDTLSLGEAPEGNLPSGVIQNFGLVIQNTSGSVNGATAFDTFTITGTPN